MKQKNRNDFTITHLSIGLILGIFLGAGIVYLTNNRQLDRELTDKLSTLRKVIGNTNQADNAGSNQSQAPKSTQESKSSGPTAREHVSASETAQQRATVKDGTTTSPELSRNHEPAPKAYGDTLALGEPIDYPTSATGSAGDIRLARDKLLFSRKYKIPVQQNPKDPLYNRLDSLLGNVHATKPKAESSLIVEFWESPLSATGYKMGKNKVMIYGIYMYDFVHLHMYENTIYLKYFDNFYALEITNNLKPLVAVTDTTLLHEFKKLWE